MRSEKHTRSFAVYMPNDIVFAGVPDHGALGGSREGKEWDGRDKWFWALW